MDKRMHGFTVSEANGADRREETLLDDAWACAKVLLAAKRAIKGWTRGIDNSDTGKREYCFICVPGYKLGGRYNANPEFIAAVEAAPNKYLVIYPGGVMRAAVDTEEEAFAVATLIIAGEGNG